MAESENQIGFEQLGIGSVLRQNLLVVPPNQREYSWTDKEITTLLQDFARAVVEGERGYFLGTIVTIPRQSGKLEVVDGQQRLATTAIFLSEIRDYLMGKEDILGESITNEFLTGIDRAKRERVPKLQLNLDDNDYFRARITKSGEDSLSRGRLSHKRIDEAFKQAKKQVRQIVAGIAPKDHGDILNKWIHFIENDALVILLRVPNDVNAYKMFETLNDRGLKTSQSDLVKNYLFGGSGDRLQEVQQKWTLMRGALESLEDEDITINFLRHALIVMQGFIRDSQVYETVQAQAKSEQLSVTFATNLEFMANAYVATYNPEHEKWNSYPDRTRRAIEVLNLFNIRPLRPLMLAVASRFSEEEAAKAFTYFISLGVRLLIAGSTRSGSVEHPLATTANRVFASELATTEELKSSFQDVIPNDPQFQESFETASVSNTKLARYYLRSLEMVAKDETEPWLIPNNDRQVINLEHILPKNPEGNWPLFEDEYVKMYSKRIGNLALLQASANSDLKSKSFMEKKTVYAISPYVLTKQISEADDWTVEKIASRQKTLAELAISAWPI